MKIVKIIFLFGLTIIVKSEEIKNNNLKKTFTFSGDSNLNSPYLKNKENENKKNEIINMEKQEKEDSSNENTNDNNKSSDNKIKEMISEISESISKKNHLENLPINEFSKEDEENARENGSFLSDDMEEASHNFAESESNEEYPEKETENKNIKKYQAEVINSMNHSGIYQKMDISELESLQNITNNNNEEDEKECYHDYSLACPLNFFRTSSGCIPMKSYKGPCKKIQEKLILLKDEQKKSWEELCETNWPCLPKICPGGSDYSINCPIGWIQIINHNNHNHNNDNNNNNNNIIICKNEYNNNKNNICGNELNLTNKNESDKKELEKKCGLRWKCKSPIYFENYNVDCPFNWISISSNKCKGPSNYNGDCPNIINLKNYKNIESKKKVEIACLVNWPYEIHYQKYQRDYSINCPIGWSLLKNNYCKAPENYKENDICKNVLSFNNMNTIQKESYSTKCSIDFPFKDKDNCKKDYSFQCPLGWIPTNKKGYCKAPLDYNSKICKKISKFQNLSENHIEFYKKSCNIEWPCEGEIQNSMIYTNEPIDFPNRNIRNTKSGAVDSESGLII